jgi:anti-anti-sigma factor
MALKITISEEKDITLLELEGRIDSFSIDELNSGFNKVMKTGKKNILLIMKDLEYINSKGLGVLISFFKWVTKVGGLVKIAEVPLNIMQVLNLLGLDGLALIYESSSDAKESFRRQQLKEERIEEYEPSERVDTLIEHPSYKGNKVPFILLGAGFLALFVVAVFLINRVPIKATGVDLAPLQSKLDLLETRLVRLEEHYKDFSQVQMNIAGLKNSLSGRMDQLSVELDKLKMDLKQTKEKTVASIPSKRREPQTTVVRYHKVRYGESLYRISRRYGISISELCRLNNLDPKKHIYPGQRLKLGFSGSEKKEGR